MPIMVPGATRMLRLNVHFHTLMLDGVFAEGDDGILELHAAEAPSDEEVAGLLATIYRRVRRLLARRGVGGDYVSDVDPLAEGSPPLARISGAASTDRARPRRRRPRRCSGPPQR